MCARSGKRLPTQAEWFAISAAQLSDTSLCNQSSGRVAKNGSVQTCTSAEGIFDLVGNLWEWTSDDVMDGTIDGITLPASGYVASINNAGLPLTTAATPSPAFGLDYAWLSESGHFGVIRGGYYDSQGDGGRYAFHAKTPPNNASAGVGFRCVQ